MGSLKKLGDRGGSLTKGRSNPSCLGMVRDVWVRVFRVVVDKS